MHDASSTFGVPSWTFHPREQTPSIEPSESFSLQEPGACSKTKLTRNRKRPERPLPRVHSSGSGPAGRLGEGLRAVMARHLSQPGKTF